ncbi:MAG: hypothetical protein ACI4ES_12265 [Roseburia sp.]
MVTKFYDVSNLETGDVMSEMTVKEIQAFFGSRISVSKYCSENRVYLGRYKFSLSEKSSKKNTEKKQRAEVLPSPKFCDEWNSMRALFKNIEWIRKGSEAK